MSKQPLPIIYHTRCSACERCVIVCPVQALAQVNGVVNLVHPDRCTYCALCEDICPEGAITLPFLIVFAESESP